MADPTKADLLSELDLMKQKLALAEKKAADAEKKAAQKALNDPVDKQTIERKPQHPYLVPPPVPINDMTKLQYHAWRIELLTAILDSKAGRLTPIMRLENEKTLAVEEQHLIKWHGVTSNKYPDVAEEYDAQVRALIKKHSKK